MGTEVARHDSENEDEDDPRIGTVLQGRYKILERLASGGMGVVYKGSRVKLERTVAIKYLHTGFAENPDAMKRFEREAIVMSRLTHPSCVSVIDFGFDGGPYIVMDYITGQNLKELVDEGPLTPQRSLHIVHQVLAALSHAHGQGMVHRDIKPANIMLTNVQGTIDHVYVLDFGLAKYCTGGLHNDITASYVVVGTPAYMSPEQARGSGEVDESTDIYSTGVVLFELLTGTKPYGSENPLETLQMHQNAPIPSLRERLPDGTFSSELEALVERAMAKKREARFASAAEFAEALLDVPEADLMPRSVSAEMKAFEPGALSSALGDEVSAVLGMDLGLSPGQKPGTAARAGKDDSGHGSAVRRTERRTPTPSRVARRDKPEISLADTVELQAVQGAAADGAADAASDASADPVTTEPVDAADEVGEAGEAVPSELPPVSSGAATVQFPREEVSPARSIARSTARSSEARGRARTLRALLLVIPLVVAGAWLALRSSGSRDAVTGTSAGTGEPSLAGEVAGKRTGDEQGGKDPGSGRDRPARVTPDSGKPEGDETTGTEPVAIKPRPAPIVVNDIKDVETLAKQGQRDEAIRGIQKLLKSSHKDNPYLNLLLGKLLFEKDQWSEGLVAYSRALDKRFDYRKNEWLLGDLVSALGSDKTARKASSMFARSIGKAGLPALKRAASSDKNLKVRQRAAALVKKLSRRR